MGGLIGRLFREFAVTLAIAIVVSAVLSLTLTAMMCAQHPASRTREDEAGASSRASERGVRLRWSRFYDRDARGGCCDHQRLTLLVTLATRGAHRAPRACVVPEGLLPAAGHRPDRSASPRRRPTSRSRDDASASRRVADVAAQRSRRRQRGVVHRRRRHQPDAPTAAASRSRSSRATSATPTPSEIIARLQRAAARGRRHRASTCRRCRTCRSTARVSRTQYQYTLEDADPTSSPRGRRSVLERAARSCPSWRDVAERSAERRRSQLHARRSIATRAARLGVTRAGHRRHALRRLRPAHRLDDLHAAQPVPRDPRGAARGSSRRPDALDADLRARRDRRAGAAVGVRALRARRRAARDRAPGPVPGGDAVVQPRAGRRRSATRSTPIERASRELDPPPGDARATSRARPQAFRESLATEPLLILAALITVYIVLGVLYESYIHPITILSTLPSAGVGALLALMRLPASRSTSSR